MFGLNIGFDKIQSDPIHAITLMSRSWTIIKDMSKMTAAAMTVNLGSDHEKPAILAGFNAARQGSPKTRPVGAAVKFSLRTVDGKITAGTCIGSFGGFMAEWAAAGPFGAMAAQDSVLCRS